MMETPAKHVWLDPLDTDFKEGTDFTEGAVICKNKSMSFLVKYKLVQDKRAGSYRKHPNGKGVVWVKRKRNDRTRTSNAKSL